MRRDFWSNIHWDKKKRKYACADSEVPLFQNDLMKNASATLFLPIETSEYKDNMM